MLDELKAAALSATLMAAVLGIAVSAIPGRAKCAIVGDSIAVGVGLIMRECLADAKSGIPSADVMLAFTRPLSFLSLQEAMIQRVRNWRTILVRFERRPRPPWCGLSPCHARQL
jgi:hypothetical protein